MALAAAGALATAGACADGGAEGTDAAAAADGSGGGSDGAGPDAPTRDTTVDTSVDAPAAYPRPTYRSLAETGLFADFAARTVAGGIAEFRPHYVLWSDAADKRRWIRLPPGTKVDTHDMDRWTFPIGTKFWKQFSHGPLLLETRLIERYGPGREDYWMGAFVWKADGSEAIFALDGADDINGTAHDAPAQKVCGSCHNGEDGRVLGFSAVQLGRTPGEPTLRTLADRGWLSDPPTVEGADFTAPGDDLVSAALGYLHANCSHCHNPHGTSWPDTQMNLRLQMGDRTPRDTATYQTAIGQKLTYYVRQPGLTLRIAPGDPTQSAVTLRMQSRTMKVAMPPLATEIVDLTGTDLVTRWVTSLPP